MRALPDPRFPGDDGAADPAVSAALARFADDQRAAPVLSALSRTRLLVPVVALPGETETRADGLQREKTADMAAVLMQGADGRRALLAFTGLDALRAWSPAARPVPVPVADAARAALAEGAAALLVDVAGPVMFVVETADTRRLAAGGRLVAVGADYAWLVEGKTGPVKDSPGP